MPRIAVAILVVVTIGGAIAINTARYPVVWEMVSPTRGPNSPTSTLPDAATVPVASEPEDVDLSQVAPLPIRRDERKKEDVSASEPEAGRFDSAGRRGDRYRMSRATPGADAMHLVSDALDPNARGAASLDNNEPARQPQDPYGAVSTVENSVRGDLATRHEASRANDRSETVNTGRLDTTRQPPLPSPAAPIVFGSAPRGGGVGDFGSNGGGSGANYHSLSPADAAGSTHSEKWPAQVSPILKYAVQPTGAADAETDSNDWQADRPLVPIVRSGAGSSSEKSSATTDGNSVDSKKASSESDSSPVRRLPGVPMSDATTPRIMTPRSADSPIPIYPSTGK